MKTAIRHQDLLLANGEQSREADRLTIESFGISGDTLMEIAGNRAADLIMEDVVRRFDAERSVGAERHLDDEDHRASRVPGESRQAPRVLFVCGKGNNAGDAFVIARILMGYDFSVSLLPVFGTGGFTPDAQRNFDRLMKLSRETGSEVHVYQKWPGPDIHCDLVVDGIFGTGLERDVDPPVSGIVERINRSGWPVVALDIPSGLHCDTGEVLGCAVRADRTIQFGIRKLGCHIGDGPAISGERVLARLPFPPVCKQDIRARLLDMQLEPKRYLLPEEPDIRQPLGKPVRTRSTRRHKYDNGVVHVIGGSAGLTGAPIYAAKAAWGLGMGAVTVTFPAAWALAIEAGVPELIKKPTGDGEVDCFTEDDAGAVLENLDAKPGVVVLGPGIGRDEHTLAFVRMVVRGCRHPLIIDADALHAIPGHEQILSGREQGGPVILTPHPGELAVLTGKQPATDHKRMLQSAALSERLGCLVLAKGNPVIVHSPMDRQLLVTPYNTTVFSRAGFGDTLAGHLAAFLSRTGDPLASCELALLHGHQKIKEVTASGKMFPEPSDIT
jgi:ADP-dependent NAD(P)H-hydrate dehydratase / NAD(P)H-hydrate epimerase